MICFLETSWRCAAIHSVFIRPYDVDLKYILFKVHNENTTTMATPNPNPNNKKNSVLPSAKDHAATVNRMNMLLAKHQKTISTFKRSTPKTTTTTSSSPDNSGGSPSSSTQNQKPKSSFSALSGRSTPANSSSTATTTGNHHTHGTTSSRLDDDDLDVIPDGAGVGYVPPGKEGGVGGAIDTSASAKATRDLRGRLLGKRAREQKEEAAAAAAKRKRRMGADSESDEEEGRSKIGKARAGRRK